jgi:hypothetical protein
MVLQQVALVSQTPSVPLSEVVKVAAALQKQATRDFAPIWEVSATVDSFAKLEDVPLGYWPVVVRDDVITNFSAAGIHLDENGQPFALVQASDDWPLTSSHEVLEMLADPFGERVIAGRPPKQGGKKAADMKRVEYLIEVCDPSEADEFSYTVNDITMSDFYTPQFFEPVQASGVRYSFTGAITKPRTVLRGGYISFHNTVDNHWYQIQWFSTANPVLADLGVFAESSMSTREWIDKQTNVPRMKKISKTVVKRGDLFAGMPKTAGTMKAAPGRAKQIEAKIAKLLKYRG